MSGNPQTLKFIKTVGTGAFGAVYLAEMNSGQGFLRRVAVKFILANNPESQKFLDRLRDEALLLGLIQDNEIIQVLSLVKIDNLDAILMEYVEGIDLAKAFKVTPRLSPRAIAELGTACAGALSRIHEAKHPKTNMLLDVIHRDIKPANIMLTKSGHIKICDFGVARARGEWKKAYTNPKDVLGTLEYMDPHYLISGKISPAADVYALGLCLLEALTRKQYGHPKFRQDEHEEHLNEMLKDIPTELKSIRVLLKKILHWSPTTRPNAAQCARLLSQISYEMPGESLRIWASANIPRLLKNKKPVKDAIGLLNRTVPIAYGESTPQQAMAEDTDTDIPMVTVSEPVPVKTQPKPRRNTSGEKDRSFRMGVFFGIFIGLCGYILTLIILLQE